MATAYEWTLEEMDGEDIVDSHCFDSLVEAMAAFSPQDVVVLRKLKSNRDGDSIDTFASAYLTGGRLPDRFDDGSKVPARYLLEASA